jgi:hypothetical protein
MMAWASWNNVSEKNKKTWIPYFNAVGWISSLSTSGLRLCKKVRYSVARSDMME